MITRASHRIGMLAAVALFGIAVSLDPSYAAGGGGDVGPDSRYPTPPSGEKNNTDRKATSKKKQERKSGQEFRDGFRAARGLVLDGQYAAAVAAFHALGDDDHPEIA